MKADVEADNRGGKTVAQESIRDVLPERAQPCLAGSGLLGSCGLIIAFAIYRRGTLACRPRDSQRL